MDEVVGETFADEPEDALRKTVVMIKAAVVGATEAAIDIGMHLGELRLLASLEAITLDGPEAPR